MKDRKPPLSIEDELDIERERPELDEVVVESKGYKDDLLSDYKTIREKIIYAMERNATVIDESVKCVLEGGGARSVETSAAALKTLTENAGNLMKIHEMMIDLMREREEEKERQEENNGIQTSFSNIVKLVDKKRGVSNG